MGKVLSTPSVQEGIKRGQEMGQMVGEQGSALLGSDMVADGIKKGNEAGKMASYALRTAASMVGEQGSALLGSDMVADGIKKGNEAGKMASYALRTAASKVAQSAPGQVDRLWENISAADWGRLGEVGVVVRNSLLKRMTEAPVQAGQLLTNLGSLGMEDMGRLGQVVTQVTNLLEEGDIKKLEYTIGEIMEAGLFGLTALGPFVILIMFFLKAAIVSGTLAAAQRGDWSEKETVETYRNICAKMWRTYGKVFHGQEFTGLEHIPKKGGALFIYYHGPVPVDYCGLVAEVWLSQGRCISSVIDRNLMEIPGLDSVKTHFNLFPGTRDSCADLLRSGSLLGIAPGGAYESLFGDSNYPILWGSRQGFAAVAISAGVPIIPVFTENIREATLTMSGRMSSTKGMFTDLYAKTKMPLVPMYGLFPVKLRTHLGKPIHPTPGMSSQEMVDLTIQAVQNMINQHQQLPGSVKRGMGQRKASVKRVVHSAASMLHELALGDKVARQEEVKMNGRPPFSLPN